METWQKLDTVLEKVMKELAERVKEPDLSPKQAEIQDKQYWIEG